MPGIQAETGAATSSRYAVDSRKDTARFATVTGNVPFLLISALVTVWALFQNFYKIGTAPILADEPTYIDSGWRYVHGVPNPGNFEHPPLAKYLFGLAQIVAGTPSDLTASRVVCSLATLLAAAAAAVWIARSEGRWAGLLIGALLTVMPEPAGGSDGRFTRFAMLDPVAGMFMVFSVILAWEWARRSGRSAWVFAALTGLAVGLAAGSKENGFLGAIGPVCATVGLALVTRRRPEILVRAAQAATALVVSLVTFVALYLPMGQPITHIKYLIDFQSTQSALGHEIGFAGQVSSKPPWWANLWFAGHNYGSVLTVFLLACVLCALVLRRDRLVGWCVAALAAPLVFHCFIAHVTLGYYWAMWTPMFIVLAGLGAIAAIRRAVAAATSASPRLAVPVALVVGVAVLAVPVGESIDQSVIVADMVPNGPEVLPALMAEHHLTGPIISTGVGRLGPGRTTFPVPPCTAVRPVPSPGRRPSSWPRCSAATRSTPPCAPSWLSTSGPGTSNRSTAMRISPSTPSRGR